MADLLILDFAGDALDALLRALSADRASAAALLARLDQAPVAALSLGVGSSPADAQDRTVAVAFLLARTQRLAVLATVDPTRQHPIHVARTVATLQALHPGRIGVIAHASPTAPIPAASFRHGGTLTGNSADYLRLLSALWDGWPLDALATDSTPTQFVDALRLQRVNDPNFPGIGGPLTLPVDGADKPPLLLAHAGPSNGAGMPDTPGVELHLQHEAARAYTGTARAGRPGVRLQLDGTLNHAWLAAPPDTREVPDTPPRLALRERLALGRSASAGLPMAPVFHASSTALRV